MKVLSYFLFLFLFLSSLPVARSHEISSCEENLFLSPTQYFQLSNEEFALYQEIYLFLFFHIEGHFEQSQISRFRMWLHRTPTREVKLFKLYTFISHFKHEPKSQKDVLPEEKKLYLIYWHLKKENLKESSPSRDAFLALFQAITRDGETLYAEGQPLLDELEKWIDVDFKEWPRALNLSLEALDLDQQTLHLLNAFWLKNQRLPRVMQGPTETLLYYRLYSLKKGGPSKKNILNLFSTFMADHRRESEQKPSLKILKEELHQWASQDIKSWEQEEASRLEAFPILKKLDLLQDLSSDKKTFIALKFFWIKYHRFPRESSDPFELSLAHRYIYLKKKYPDGHPLLEEIFAFRDDYPLKNEQINAFKQKLLILIDTNKKLWPPNVFFIFDTFDEDQQLFFLLEAFWTKYKKMPTHKGQGQEKSLYQKFKYFKTRFPSHPILEAWNHFMAEHP
jgi:hypothetical protein